MIDEKELLAWLEERNLEYRKRGIPPKRRLLEALRDLQRDKGILASIGHPISRSISTWLEAHTQPGSMTVGPTIEGAYPFDGVVWPLQMPFLVGTARIDPKASLVGMPQALLDELFKDPESRDAYLNYWLYCADVRFLLEFLDRPEGIGHRFLKSACDEFRAGAKLLVDRADFWRSVQHSRMAVEMSCKAALLERYEWDEKGIKGLKHRLDRALQELGGFFAPRQRVQYLLYVKEFPDVGGRYEPNQFDQIAAWRMHQIALRILAEIVRKLAPGRSLRPESGLPEAIDFAL